MSSIIAKNLLKDSLNTNVLDPQEGREGNQFFTDTDGINLHRANTFPKGYVFPDTDSTPETERFHLSGWSLKRKRFLIHYFVKDKINYTDTDNVIYYDREYADYMKTLIINALEDNISLGSSYYVDSVEDIEAVRELESPKSTFKLYEVVIPVTVKWKRQHG